MNLIYTSDREFYRRGVNLIPSIFIPGAAQYLSERKKAGLAWFVLYGINMLVLLVICFHPKTRVSIYDMGCMHWISDGVWLLALIDGLRKPIRPLKSKGWFALLGCWGLMISILILALLISRQFAVQLFSAGSRSMQPTLMGDQKKIEGHGYDGDYVCVNKWIYRFADPQRGDIVVFRTEGLELPAGSQNSIWVKRVVGLPGETVRIDPPCVLINGQRLIQPVIFQKIAESRNGYSGFCLASDVPGGGLPGQMDKTVRLGPDEYFVLGDNSKCSLDSRHFGPVRRSAIVGKVFYIYAPANRKGWVE
jgi:signal peptidase I